MGKHYAAHAVKGTAAFPPPPPLGTPAQFGGEKYDAKKAEGKKKEKKAKGKDEDEDKTDMGDEDDDDDDEDGDKKGGAKKGDGELIGVLLLSLFSP
jgi:hypothetical protein